MALTRRDSLKVLGGASLLAAASSAAAAPSSSPVPIVTSGGTRLYPNNDATHWWTPQPIINGTWTLPQIVPPGPPPDYVLTGFPTMGVSLAPDGATVIQDIRNAPRHGVFTRMYQQLVTRPLQGAQTLEGTVSLAIHAVEGQRKLNAVLALQVVVHAPDGTVRDVALPVTTGAETFVIDAQARTRAILAAPLDTVPCQDGDVIAINVGIGANNETRNLSQGIGLYFLANRSSDIAYLDVATAANTWVEFSADLLFQP